LAGIPRGDEVATNTRGIEQPLARRKKMPKLLLPAFATTARSDVAQISHRAVKLPSQGRAIKSDEVGELAWNSKFREGNLESPFEGFPERPCCSAAGKSSI
jgi:hypothetical protein